MKVDVDYDVCASTGTCVQICPEVFEIRSDGYLYLLVEGGEIPADRVAELGAKVRDAEESCPTGAITVTD